MGLAAAATLPVYDFTFGLMEALLKGLARTDTGYALFNLSGAAIAGLVMLPATFCAGMTLPLITGALLRRGAGEAAIGRVYAANTLGAIAGVLLAVQSACRCRPEGDAAGGRGGRRRARPRAPRFSRDAEALSCRAWPAGPWWLAVIVALARAARRAQDDRRRVPPRRRRRIARRQHPVRTDGKTATVHLVKYPEAISLRTNGKSDGSINLNAEGERGTDEITMVLTAALPLALKPETRSAAVIGIGTGLTTHTLLQSLDLERVETVEIESAMAEAARGFMPRNSAAFADPRGAIFIDDAKSFFSTHNRRYDLIISEPSNPWVSGVSSLFTREFYRRIRTPPERGWAVGAVGCLVHLLAGPDRVKNASHRQEFFRLPHLRRHRWRDGGHCQGHRQVAGTQSGSHAESGAGRRDDPGRLENDRRRTVA